MPAIDRTAQLTRLGVVGVVLGGLSACAGGGGGTEADGDVSAPPAETVLADTALPAVALDGPDVIPNIANVLSFTVEWAADPPASASLTVSCGGDYTQTWQTPQRAEHRVFVMGLIAGSACDVVVVATAPGHGPVAATKKVVVEQLPVAIPTATARVVKPTAMAPGWTLMNLSNSFERTSLIAVMLDEHARVRWYHLFPVEDPGAGAQLHPLDTGVFVCSTSVNIPFMEVDWQGRLVYENARRGHHDCRFVDAERRRVAYLGETDACPDGVTAGTVVEFDRETDETLWEWSICDHWLPDTVEEDWSHLNTLAPFADEDAWLVSSRTQHSLLKVAQPSGDVLWRMGPGGDFSLPNESRFWRQHAAEVLPNGNIIMFDNGAKAIRPYSRAIELAVDETEMTAEVVWEFAPKPAIWAPIWGDADRLDNGNTLVTFGLRDEALGSHVIEVDAEAREVWHATLPDGWGIYRSDRVPQRFGEILAE